MSFLREGISIVLRCLGSDVEEIHQFLRAFPGNPEPDKIRLTGAPSDPDTTWIAHETGTPGTFAFECESVGEARFLDGRTLGCNVGLAPDFHPPFIGAAWRVVDIPNPEGGAHVTLQCQGNLGQIQLAQCPFGFLNGRTGVNDGGVDLAPNTGPPFSGTRWELIVAPVPPDGGGDTGTGGTPTGPHGEPI